MLQLLLSLLLQLLLFLPPLLRLPQSLLRREPLQSLLLQLRPQLLQLESQRLQRRRLLRLLLHLLRRGQLGRVAELLL